jgi:hypothetical protein
VSPAEHGRPSLEVRRCGDGHPPVTERERVIRLNGIGGVRFQKTRIEISIRVFLHEPSSSAKRSEIDGSRVVSQLTATGFFDLARNDNVINAPTNLKIHAHH